MTQEQVLDVFRRCGALLHGHFVLRSGKHSRTFFQCALVLQDPESTAELCGALAAKLTAERWTFDSVISPAMGGILVGHEVGAAPQAAAHFCGKGRRETEDPAV